MKVYRKRRSSPTVSLVSMIDILAILLIFFIVTTTFKRDESLVRVNLPRSSEMGSETDRERRIPLTLGKNGRISLGSTELPMEGLAGALRDFKNSRPDEKLEIKADEGAPLGLLVKVWDAATRAGLEIGELPLRILLDE